MSKLQQALAKVQAPSISIKGLEGATFRATPVQAQQVNQTNYSGQLIGLAQLGAQAYDKYAEYREQQATERRNEILLKNLKPEQIGELRASGTLLYQDDPWAMRSLERELGRQEAYSVDAIVRERIAAGDYPSRSEMESDRAQLMALRRKEMGQTYAIQDTSEGWEKGWKADIVERNMAIYDAQARKQDQMHRNETRVVVESNLSSLISSGRGDAAIAYLNKQKADGLIRNDTEYEAYLTKALKDLASTPGSIDMVRTVMESEIEMYGNKTTLRSRLGEEYMRSLENHAAQASLSYNWESQKWWMDKANVLESPDFSVAGTEFQALDNMREMQQFIDLTQGEASTAAKVEFERLKANYNKRHAAWVQQQREEITKQQQQHVRVAMMDSRVTGRMNGDMGLSLKLSSFEETEQTGKYTTNDWNAYFTFKSNQINNSDMTPEQKSMRLLELGATLKDIPDAGFGAHYAEVFDRAGGELSKYIAAQNAGVDVPETPTLNQLMELHKANPSLFVSTFGSDSALTTDIAMAANLGVHPSVLFKGKSRLDEVKKYPDQYQQLTQELKNLESRRGSNIYQVLNTNQREAIQAAYLGMEGLDNGSKMKLIEKHLTDQFEVMDGGISGVVPKSFLMSDPRDPSTVSVGKTRLQNLIQDTFGSTDGIGVSVSGENIIIFSSLRATPIVYTKDMLMNLQSVK